MTSLRTSVIIPTWNRAGYLRETLESVVAQDIQPLEILVVDDGSTDDTAEVVDAFAPLARRLSTSRVGPARAFQTGAEAARGELLALRDDDDIWRPAFLKVLTDSLAERPGAVVAFCRPDHIDGEGRDLPGVTLSREPTEGNVFQHLLEGNFLRSFSSALVRRSAFDRAGGLDPELRTSMDWDLWLRLARIGEFRLVPRPLARKRLHGENYSDNLHLVYEDRLRILGKTARLDPDDETLGKRVREKQMHTRLVLARTYGTLGMRWKAAALHLSLAATGAPVLSSLRAACRALLRGPRR